MCSGTSVAETLGHDYKSPFDETDDGSSRQHLAFGLSENKMFLMKTK